MDYRLFTFSSGSSLAATDMRPTTYTLFSIPLTCVRRELAELSEVQHLFFVWLDTYFLQQEILVKESTDVKDLSAGVGLKAITASI